MSNTYGFGGGDTSGYLPSAVMASLRRIQQMVSGAGQGIYNAAAPVGNALAGYNPPADATTQRVAGDSAMPPGPMSPTPVMPPMNPNDTTNAPTGYMGPGPGYPALGMGAVGGANPGGMPYFGGQGPVQTTNPNTSLPTGGNAPLSPITPNSMVGWQSPESLGQGNTVYAPPGSPLWGNSDPTAAGLKGGVLARRPARTKPAAKIPGTATANVPANTSRFALLNPYSEVSGVRQHPSITALDLSQLFRRS